jgi:type II secretory pathway component PulM
MLTMKLKEQQKEQWIKAGVGLLMIVICYVLIFQPAFRDVAFLQQKILDSKKRLDLYQDIQGSKKSLATLESSLATAQDRTVILGKISDLASQSQIKVQTLNPKTQPEGEYSRLNIELVGRGSFFSLLKFFRAIEGASVSLKATNISLLRQSSSMLGEEKYPLQIQIGLGTFLKQRSK